MKKLKLISAALMLNAPMALKRVVYAGRRKVIDGRKMDVSAKSVADLMLLLRDPSIKITVEQSRAQLEAMVKKFDRSCPESVSRRDITLPGGDGDRPARVYAPESMSDGEPAPTLLFMHGGGWIQGSLDTHDGLCGELAAQAGIRVISYDYRLAPEHPFPAAADDVLAAYRALMAAPAAHGIDPERLAVGGDSAGANLTTGLMHDLSEAGEETPAAQLLIYPAVDGRMISDSIQKMPDDSVLPEDRRNWYFDLYAPNREDRVSPRLSALLSPHHADCPQAFIIAAGHDPLWDDAFAYAEALKTAGVPATVEAFPGQIHAFVSLTKIIPEGAEAVRRSAVWLKSVLVQG